MSKAMEGHRRWFRNRQSWPKVLNRFFTPALWRALGEGQPRDGNQARAGWTPKFLVLLSLLIGWSGKRQLTARFSEARAIAASLYPDESGLPTSYQGFFKQLRRADLENLRAPLRLLREKAPQYIGDDWQMYNWVPIGVDGSRVEAPRTAANEEAMGRAGRTGTGPQLWVTTACHLPTGLLWDWRQGPGTSSERGHLMEMVGDLPERALVVADAGFVGYDVMRAMDRAGQPFLIRCGGNVTLLLGEEPVEAKLERSRYGTRVYLWPEGKRAKGFPPLVLRLIILKRKGKKVYLLTNVLDSQALPKWMASELYAARWEIEVSYRSLKQTLDRRKLLAESPDNAKMELASYLLALSVLVLHGIVALGRRCRALSVALALRALREAMEGLRWGVEWDGFSSHMKAALRDSYERSGSKRARTWPHKKTQRPPGPPKLRRLLRAERKQLRCLGLAAP